jgi:hypothetical protein
MLGLELHLFNNVIVGIEDGQLLAVMQVVEDSFILGGTDDFSLQVYFMSKGFGEIWSKLYDSVGHWKLFVHDRLLPFPAFGIRVIILNSRQTIPHIFRIVEISLNLLQCIVFSCLNIFD